MRQPFLFFSCVNMALGISFGAFGAHYLKGILTEPQLDSFKTGVMYQLILSVALFAFSNSKLAQLKTFCKAASLIAWGTVLFVGSIYLLTLRNIFPSLSILSVAGPITPLGGLLIISGWFKMAYHSRQAVA
ncbi:MAG: uncharacterized membrane protein YgdD (TMEM256/DUF423 family) [Flavobacteriales bacterium]|jgi:uncharacterized membrane protein YgdD (TMEM256/DUF423 family)